LNLVLVSITLATLGLVLPAFAGGPIFVSPGGAYNGVVGEPVQMDASGSWSQDGGQIRGYYWDWFADGVCECFTLPKCQYTWHSAYTGTLVLNVWDEHNDLGVGECPIVVTGPQNLLTATLRSSANLHVFGPRNYHTGLSSITGQMKTQLPGSSFGTLHDGATQVIAWPLYIAGTYRVQAVGTADGPFELTILATQDGTRILEKTVSGRICKGETLTVNVTGCCEKGQLQVAFDAPAYCPGIGIEPSEIKLVVEAGRTYEVPLTVREPFLKTALSSVTFSNEDIAGPVNKVNAGAVEFLPGTLDLTPGGQETVVATIPVPQVFLGKATGRIVARSANGAVGVVNVTIMTAGSCPPHCNGIGPITGLVGAAVTFDASNSYDPDGAIVHYCWDWDLDGDFEWTVQPVITHTWSAPFAGKVRLLVFDNDSECADTFVDVTITNP
jgi:hypothetical protein